MCSGKTLSILTLLGCVLITQASPAASETQVARKIYSVDLAPSANSVEAEELAETLSALGITGRTTTSTKGFVVRVGELPNYLAAEEVKRSVEERSTFRGVIVSVPNERAVLSVEPLVYSPFEKGVTAAKIIFGTRLFQPEAIYAATGLEREQLYCPDQTTATIEALRVNLQKSPKSF